MTHLRKDTLPFPHGYATAVDNSMWLGFSTGKFHQETVGGFSQTAWWTF
jgi:hypothetical protein